MPPRKSAEGERLQRNNCIHADNVKQMRLKLKLCFDLAFKAYGFATSLPGSNATHFSRNSKLVTRSLLRKPVQCQLRFVDHFVRRFGFQRGKFECPQYAIELFQLIFSVGLRKRLF